MCGDRYVRDHELDEDEREVLREYTTPRRGVGGELIWLLNELECCDE